MRRVGHIPGVLGALAAMTMLSAFAPGAMAPSLPRGREPKKLTPEGFEIQRRAEEKRQRKLAKNLARK